MGEVFTTLDLVLFFAMLIGVMAVGLIAGWKEETSEDYFLAGRKIPWWGVAGSIFGSNVSANHMVGMMGIGFSIGFAQSHFELGAIFGLLFLCYGLLPVYRKLNIFTLSEYLGRRYDDRSRVSYAVIMVLIMVVVQMVPGLYIGARSICVLVSGDAAQQVPGQHKQTVGDLLAQQEGAAANAEANSETPDEIEINKSYYAAFVIALAVIAAAYTILGGLKAVVWTDIIQSVLLLVAGIVIAFITFSKLGGWDAMMAMDLAAGEDAKMKLYLPPNHEALPWTGVFTGLIAMHCFYWGTNQFIVQRALAARSDSEARLGIIVAGFLKLLIPFFAIATGIAAVYLFKESLPNRNVAPDTAFSELVKLVIPLGTGIIGLISAGLIGAILSSIDSMMNSAATIVTFDIYKRYINPTATDRQMIFVGRVTIVVFVTVAAIMAIFILNPNSKENFFLQIVDYQNYLTPGLLVAFILGIFWKRATATGAFVTILAGIVFSWVVVAGYDHSYGMNKAIYKIAMAEESNREAVLLKTKVEDLPESVRKSSFKEIESYVRQQESRLNRVNRFLGPQLNFFHRVVGVILLCILIHVIVSTFTKSDSEKSRLVWTDLGGHAPGSLRNLILTVLLSIVVFAILGYWMYAERLSPSTAAIFACVWTLGVYARQILLKRVNRGWDAGSRNQTGIVASIVSDDLFWAGILCAIAVFMHFYFF